MYILLALLLLSDLGINNLGNCRSIAACRYSYHIYIYIYIYICIL